MVDSFSIRAEAYSIATMVITARPKAETTQFSFSKVVFKREPTNLATSVKLKAKKAQTRRRFHQ